MRKELETSEQTITRRRLLETASLVAGGALLARCVPSGVPAAGTATTAPTAAGQPAPTQELVIGMSLEARGLDPIRNDTASQYAYKQVFDPLVAMDADLKPIPHAAQSWDISADGTVYTFKLRPGIKFHDGSDLTSEDVKFTFDRILDPKNASDKRTYVAMVSNVEAVDPLTVRIRLNAPYAPFIYSAMQQIVPKAVAERAGDGFARKPVGSGPFKFVEWVPNERIVFARNDNYWLKRPSLEKVTLKIIPDSAVAASNLLAGDVDVIEQVTTASFPQLRGNPNVEILTVASAQYTYIGFGLMGRAAPFNDKRFREAVYHAFDADAVVQALFPQSQIATRAYATLPSTSAYWPGGEYAAVRPLALRRDPARAKQLFDELVRDGVMPANYRITFLTDQNDARRRSAEAVVAGLNALGLTVELLSLEFGSYAGRLQSLPTAKAGMLYTVFTNPAAPDPDLSLYWLFHSTGGHGRFLGMPPGTELDRKLDQARTSTSQTERQRIYNEVMREAMSNVYNIPLFHENIVVAYNKKVQGLRPSPRWDWNLVTNSTDVQIVTR